MFVLIFHLFQALSYSHLFLTASDTSFTSHIVRIISIHMAWNLQLQQFSLLPLI